MEKGKKIIFIIPYPIGSAPSQRFRFEQYFEILKKHHFNYDIAPFWSENAWKILYQKGGFIRKTASLSKAIIRRYLLLFRISHYDYIFIHREYSPVGWPLAVWIIVRLMKKKIIFDFDDAIWIKNYSESNKISRLFKKYGNTAKIIRMSYKVSCGNEYLKNYALQYNSQSFVNPTTIDTDHYHNRTRQLNKDKFIIGWTGSHSTIQYLDDIIPVIKELENEYPIEFRVISDLNPKFDLNSFHFSPWHKDSEINELLSFSIGIMPLKHDSWSEGKCGFKALQYMALGIPALVSPVGVNTSIVDHGINGYYCRDTREWKIYIEKLINDKSLLDEMSKKTRSKIIDHYSVVSNASNFLNLFS